MTTPVSTGSQSPNIDRLLSDPASFDAEWGSLAPGDVVKSANSWTQTSYQEDLTTEVNTFMLGNPDTERFSGDVMSKLLRSLM